MQRPEQDEATAALSFWRGVLNQAQYDLVCRCLTRLEVDLGGRVSSYGPLAGAAQHILLAGGKRIRALVLFAVTEALGAGWADAVDQAVAVELIHTASLIHDDMIDGTSDRRGVRAVHQRFGASSAILTGDVLCFDAFVLASSVPEAAPVLAAACREMCVGEAMPPGPKATEMKTAPLFGAAAEVGAVVAGAAPGLREQCRRYGRLLGMAFQLRDDQLDGEGLADPRPYAEDARACIAPLPDCAARGLLLTLAGSAAGRNR